ncbi:hypothetical protein MRX96_026867 [Rhipicephalus microplus]
MRVACRSQLGMENQGGERMLCRSVPRAVAAKRLVPAAGSHPRHAPLAATGRVCPRARSRDRRPRTLANRRMRRRCERTSVEGGQGTRLRGHPLSAIQPPEEYGERMQGRVGAATVRANTEAEET